MLHDKFTALTVISGVTGNNSIFAGANALLKHSLEEQVSSNLPRLWAKEIS